MATVVVISRGPRGLKDPTPYNHYSLLSTIEGNFGLGCLANACDTTAAKPMTAPFTPSASAAGPTTMITPPTYDTPTPTPGPGQEPVAYTTAAATGDGWTVQPAGGLGRFRRPAGRRQVGLEQSSWFDL